MFPHAARALAHAAATPLERTDLDPDTATPGAGAGDTGGVFHRGA